MPSVLLVFAAGLLSFLSPCIVPLIPSYLGILGSVKQDGGKPALLLTTVSFILGFSTVFVILSILVSASFSLMGGVSAYIRIAAGIIVIVLGLNVLFDFLSVLNYEKRFQYTKRPKGLFGVFLAGAAFGSGWSPCIGLILTSVLLLAAQSGKTATAALYLAVYSLGLGLPFLLAALLFERFLAPGTWLRRHLPLIRKLSGVLLVIMGLLILLGRFSALNILLQQWQYQFIDWAQDRGGLFRVIAGWLEWLQSM